MIQTNTMTGIAETLVLTRMRGISPSTSKMNFVKLLLQPPMIWIFITSLHFCPVVNAQSPDIFPNYDSLHISMCNDSWLNLRHKLDETQPVLYIVTPTFHRREQFPELTRLSQTLLHVPNMIWLLIEDAMECSPILSNLLERCQIPYVHMVAPLPDIYLSALKKPRGVSQRNAAIQWILTNSNLPEGVLYFADDDNTFDLRLFKDIRHTKKVSMFPIGLMGGTGVNSPVVQNGLVVGFVSRWFGKRKFPVDMGEFAVNIRHLSYNHTRVAMPFLAGYEEDLFLKGIVSMWTDIEPMAEGCTKIWVWHTTAEEILTPVIHPQGGENNLQHLLSELQSTGVVGTNNFGLGLPVCPMGSICV